MTRPYRLPAMPNVHSHAFQRDLRGIGERPSPAGDDFWGWREAMYALAGALDPASMRAAGERAYAEMAAAGYGAVGEFHYVHHRPDGTPYDDPNAMATALAEAATGAGLRIVLLPAAYHRAGPNVHTDAEVGAAAAGGARPRLGAAEGGGKPPPTPGQRRFCDPTVDAFLERVDALRAWAAPREGVSVGVAAHSVRAVPADWLAAIAAYADEHALVRHIHAHEQPRELEECRAEHGCSPIELLERTGFLGPRTTVVHGIHVDERDIALLADSNTIVASCPTTEGSLGDGHFPALAYRDAGVRLAIGSDSHVVIDPFEEVRELETGARRERRTRHALLAAAGDLWTQLCRTGCESLGIEHAGTIEIDLDHPRLHGVEDRDVPLAVATCASAETVLPRTTRPAPPRSRERTGSARPPRP